MQIREEIGIRDHRDYLQKEYSYFDQVWATETSVRKVPTTQLGITSKLVHDWLNIEVEEGTQ